MHYSVPVPVFVAARRACGLTSAVVLLEADRLRGEAEVQLPAELQLRRGLLLPSPVTGFALR